MKNGESTSEALRSIPSLSRNYVIAVLPGDGIGTEVMTEGIRVLRATESRLRGVTFQLRHYSVGAGEFLRSGDPLSEETLRECREADAILLGAMGLPNVRWPDGREITPQIDLRERLDLYCGLRPIRLYHAQDTPLKGLSAGSIDLLLVRENCEGLFSTRLAPRAGNESAVRDELRVTRNGSERIFHAAFAQARRRRKKLTLVDKANVLPSMVFFREIFQEVAAQYPEVQTECAYVDAASLYLLQRPQSYDVLVTENMFGDILSDLAAGLVGGMGLAPSADIGNRHAVFQPAHGTAPDIMGRGIANPVATILSVAMMLEWLGNEETRRGAFMIQRAVESALAKPAHRTADLGGKLSTEQMTDRILDEL